MGSRRQGGFGRGLAGVLALGFVVACSAGTDDGAVATTSEGGSSTVDRSAATAPRSTTEAPTTTTEPGSVEADLAGLWYSTDLGEGGLSSFVLNVDGTLSVFVLADPNRTFSTEPGQRGIDETIAALRARGAPGTWAYDEAGDVLTVEAGSLPSFEFEVGDGLLAGAGIDYAKADPGSWPPPGA